MKKSSGRVKMLLSPLSNVRAGQKKQKEISRTEPTSGIPTFRNQTHHSPLPNSSNQ